MTDEVRQEASQLGQEGQESEVGDVGGEDGADDLSNLDSSGVVQSVVQIVVDLLDENVQVERVDALGHGVHQVGDTASGLGADLVGDLSPVGDDGVETAELERVSEGGEGTSVDCMDRKKSVEEDGKGSDITEPMKIWERTQMKQKLS